MTALLTCPGCGQLVAGYFVSTDRRGKSTCQHGNGGAWTSGPPRRYVYPMPTGSTAGSTIVVLG